MSEYRPSPRKWVADQVELYESSGGAAGYKWRDTDLPVILVTHRGHKTGAIRKTPLMRVADGRNYILVASQGGAPEHPQWYHNLKADPNVEIRDKTEVHAMRVREVTDPAEREQLWKIAVEAFPNYAEYQKKTERLIPVFLRSRWKKRTVMARGMQDENSKLPKPDVTTSGNEFQQLSLIDPSIHHGKLRVHTGTKVQGKYLQTPTRASSPGVWITGN